MPSPRGSTIFSKPALRQALGVAAVVLVLWLASLWEATDIHTHVLDVEGADIQAVCLVRGLRETCAFTIPAER